MRVFSFVFLWVGLLGVALLQCKSDEDAENGGQRVTQNIGTEGGSLSSVDGTARLVVPPGALASSTELSLEVLKLAP